MTTESKNKLYWHISYLPNKDRKQPNFVYWLILRDITNNGGSNKVFMMAHPHVAQIMAQIWSTANNDENNVILIMAYSGILQIMANFGTLPILTKNNKLPILVWIPQLALQWRKTTIIPIIAYSFGWPDNHAHPKCPDSGIKYEKPPQGCLHILPG